MSASNAYDEISALVSNHDAMANSDYKEYADTQSKYLVPVNNGSYSNQIVFDSRELIKSWWTPAHSYLSIPVKLVKSGAGADYDATTIVSFKEGVLDLVSGLIVNLSGQQVVNSNQTMRYNALRRKLAHDLGWKGIHENELCSAQDEAEFKTNVVGRILPVNDITKNAGLARRVRNTKAQLTTTATAGELRGVFRLPLCYLHTMFESMDFPIINSQFQITVLLNTSLSTSGSQYPPCTVATGTDAPRITVEGFDGLSEPRLYYNEVFFHGALGQKLASMLQSGITKRLFFTESEILKFQTTASGATNAVRGVVTPSVIAPSRMFIITPPKDSLTASASDALVGSVGRFQSVQASINNSPIFARSLDTDYEQYTQLKDEFSNVGSDIAPAGYSFQQWKDGDSVLCINYSKHSKDKLVNGNSSCSLAIDVVPASGNPALDWYCIVERKKHMLLNMSASGTVTTIGDGY